MIDAVLLRHLRTAGMSDAMVAAHAEGVAAQDARAQRSISAHCSGEATYGNGLIMCPVRLAHGIHWCGGELRMNRAHHSLPSTVENAVIGRPLRAILEHALLDPSIVVTGVRHEDDARFDAGGRAEGDPRVVILETDAAPVAVASSGMSRLLAPWTHFWRDRVLVAEPGNGISSPWAAKRMVAMNSVGMAVMSGIGATAFGWTHGAAGMAVWGLGGTILWMGATVIASNHGVTAKADFGLAHRIFQEGMRERQQAEGMRD